MSTRVKDRKNNNKFEILTKITNLCGRTRDIVNHEKFNANVTLRTDLINSAEAIYFFARRANRYRTDRTKEELLKRRELQNKAVDGTRVLWQLEAFQKENDLLLQQFVGGEQ